MTVSASDLLGFVVASNADAPFAEQCVQEGAVLVTNFIGTTTTVPEVIKDRAVLAVAAELLGQRDAPNGIAQFADGVGNTVGLRVARDPMRAAYPLLMPFLPGGFA